MTIKKLFEEKGYRLRDLAPEKRAVTNIDKLLPYFEKIDIIERGYTKTNTKGFKYNFSVSCDARRFVFKVDISRGDVSSYVLEDLAVKMATILKNNGIKSTKNCKKCNGTGVIKRYMHYCNGICFDCFGVS